MVGGNGQKQQQIVSRFLSRCSAAPTDANELLTGYRDAGSRSLFEAVAVMTGLSPLVRELEARLARTSMTPQQPDRPLPLPG
jgi:hypothetical protein